MQDVDSTAQPTVSEFNEVSEEELMARMSEPEQEPAPQPVPEPEPDPEPVEASDTTPAEDVEDAESMKRLRKKYLPKAIRTIQKSRNCFPSKSTGKNNP